jgi:hypothetical protein
VIRKGTIAYGFTFATGFTLVWIDSAGPVTDGDRALAQKLGPVDIAIVAYQGHPVSQVQVPVTLALVARQAAHFHAGSPRRGFWDFRGPWRGTAIRSNPGRAARHTDDSTAAPAAHLFRNFKEWLEAMSLRRTGNTGARLIWRKSKLKYPQTCSLGLMLDASSACRMSTRRWRGITKRSGAAAA